MADWRAELEAKKRASNCRITTRGRRSGKPHSVPIWFAVGDDGNVLLATLRLDRDWPKNVQKNPEVEIAIGALRLRGQARLVIEEPKRTRIEEALRRKYLVSRVAGWFGLRPAAVFEVTVDGEAR